MAAIVGARPPRAATVFALNLMLVILLSARASAQFTSFSAPLTAATDFVTGFSTCGLNGALGPTGVLFDGTNFFADDVCDATTYQFTAAGGSVSAPDAQLQNGLTHGLALSNGVYYGNAGFSGEGLYEFDPNTLDAAIVATFPPLAASPPFPPDTANLIAGVVGDPLTTDLYVSTHAGLFIVQDPNSGSPTVSNVCPQCLFDLIAFTDDGMQFYGGGAAGTHVYGFDRTPSLVLDVDTGHPIGGIAVAPNNAMAGGTDVSNNIFVNSDDGTLLRVDVNNGNAVSVVASGGTGGDFLTLGPDGCLYATQADRIEKMSPCFF